MTEDQLLNLRAGDIIHRLVTATVGLHIPFTYCQKWIIDYKIDKYVAHGVVLLNDEDHSYLTTWFRHEDLDNLHLPEECLYNQESQA